MPDIYLSPSIRVKDKGDGTWVIEWNNSVSGIWETKFLIDHDTGELLTPLGISGNPPKLQLKDTGAGGAERRITSDGGRVKILDSADVEVMDIEAHADRHQNGGADEISVAGLSGELADPQPPKAHAASHKSGGADVVNLDELGAPTGPVNFNGQKATGLGAPTASGDAARKDELDTKADKVTTPTAGDFAGLDADGNLTDSGHKDADYADAVHAAEHKSDGSDVLNHYMVVQAHKSSVDVSQSDAEIFEFTAPAALTLSEVQVYCTATAATASVDVKEAGVSVLLVAATPSAGAVVKPTISDSAIASGAAVTVHVTTDGTGTITDLTVTLVFTLAVL